MKHKNQQPYLKGLFDSIRQSQITRGVSVQPLCLEARADQPDAGKRPECKSNAQPQAKP